MNPTKKHILLLNKLIEKSINYNHDFFDKMSVVDAMFEYNDEIFGKESGVIIGFADSYYPHFIIDDSDGGTKE